MSSTALPGKHGDPEVHMQTVEPAVATTRHPLDPLTADEVQAASSILKKERGLDAGHRFVYVMLNEPAKKDVLA
ncbi:MAG TPA: hypothetical protein VK535_07770, partial [Gemmatimonadales bacterium]|nr:hypothetical protein [Gemmatimonadales bacterium]